MTHDVFIVSGVLFDLDNTLFDRDGAVQHWADNFARSCLDLHDDKARLEAAALALALDAHGYGSKPAMFAAFREQYSVLSQSLDDLVASFYKEMPAYATLDEGARRLLDALDRARTPFGIVTNGTHHQMLTIGALGLDRRAQCILISEIVGCRKPDAAIFIAAASRLDLQPEEVLFVGDNPEADIGGAHRAGMRTAWLQRGQTWPAALSDRCVDFTISSLSEVIDIVLDTGGGRDDAHEDRA